MACKLHNLQYHGFRTIKRRLSQFRFSSKKGRNWMNQNFELIQLMEILHSELWIFFSINLMTLSNQNIDINDPSITDDVTPSCSWLSACISFRNHIFIVYNPFTTCLSLTYCTVKQSFGILFNLQRYKISWWRTRIIFRTSVK